MTARVTLDPLSLRAEPGSEAVCAVTIRNQTSIVEEFTVEVLGDSSAWTTAEPPSVSLFPNEEGVVVLRFRPPRTPTVRAGPLPFGVRVTAAATGEVTVEEGTVEVGRFAQVTASIRPQTSEAKRVGHHDVTVTNQGNAVVDADFSATDPDDQLALSVDPARLQLSPGQSAAASVTARVRRSFLRGASKRRPFQVTVQPIGDTPIPLDAALQQRAITPGWVLPAVAALAVVGILGTIFSGKGPEVVDLIAGQGEETTTTVSAVPGAGDGEGGGGETTTTAAPAGGGQTTTSAGAGSSGGGGATTTTATTQPAPPPIIIDFEDIESLSKPKDKAEEAPPPKEPVAIVLTDQYADRGVTFNEPVVIDYSKPPPPKKVSNDFAHSRTRGIEQCAGLATNPPTTTTTTTPPPPCRTPIVMTFSLPQPRVKVWVGHNGPPGLRGIILRALDANGKEVDKATKAINVGANPVPISQPLEVKSEKSDIAKVEVKVVEVSLSDKAITTKEVSTQGLAVDDVEFERAPKPAPTTTKPT